MLRNHVQRVGVVNVDPGISVTFRIVELSEVDGDVDPAIEEAQVSVMIRNGNRFLNSAGSVGFDEVCREGPVECVAFVRADALKVMLVVALALHVAETRRIICGVKRRGE